MSLVSEFMYKNKTYILPELNTNNIENFDVLKQIMLKYNYYEFYSNFYEIYTNSNDYSKKMCYMRRI